MAMLCCQDIQSFQAMILVATIHELLKSIASRTNVLQLRLATMGDDLQSLETLLDGETV